MHSTLVTTVVPWLFQLVRPWVCPNHVTLFTIKQYPSSHYTHQQLLMCLPQKQYWITQGKWCPGLPRSNIYCMCSPQCSHCVTKLHSLCSPLSAEENSIHSGIRIAMYVEVVCIVFTGISTSKVTYYFKMFTSCILCTVICILWVPF